MSEERYLYEVHPVKMVRITGRTPMRKACSLMLTKEEVREAMSSARLYRKVNNLEASIPVTGITLDDLHVSDEVLYTKGYKKVVNESTSKRTDYTTPEVTSMSIQPVETTEEPVVELTTTEDTDDLAEAAVEIETPTNVEEKLDGIVVDEEVKNLEEEASSGEDNTYETLPEVTTEVEVEPVQKVSAPQIKVNYNGNNNKKKK